jgi:NADH-quinone oxidoreductase subunit M
MESELAAWPHLYAVDQLGFPLLSAIIFLPLAFAAWIFCTHDAAHARRLAWIACAFEIALTLLAVAVFDPSRAGMQFMEDFVWMSSLNVRYQLGIDGISLFFLPLTALLFAGVIIASWTSVHDMIHSYLGLLLTLLSFTMGVFCSLDLVLFFAFWELTVVPVYFLVTLWGIGPERRFAGMKYALMMLAGGVPLLLGIVLLGLNHADPVGDAASPGMSFSYFSLIETPLPEQLGQIVFLLLFVGFAVKAPLFPFHTWLPKLAMEGPTGVSAVIVGLKLGAYGLLRFAVPLAPAAFREYAWLVGTLGAIGVVYGGLLALNQTNLRRLLAFSSVSHVGLVALGIAAMNIQGLEGAIFQTLNFAIVAGGIFLLAGFIQHRLGTTEVASLGGLARSAPLLSAFFLLLGLASIGVPGTNGFVAESLLLVGISQAHLGMGLAGVFGIVIGAAYMLGFFRRAFYGPVRRQDVAAMADLQTRERALLSVGAVLVLAAGFFPDIVLSSIASAAQAWIERLD